MSFDPFFKSLFSGVLLGSLYFMMATGLTLCWGVLGIFNFAHGAIVMCGAYMAYVCILSLHLNYLVVFALITPFLFCLGIFIERFIMRPLLSQTGKMAFTAVIMTTLAISNILENAVLMIFGGRMKRLPKMFKGVIRLGPITPTYDNIVIITVSLVILITMVVALKKTKVGMAVRAVEQDKEASYLVGINVKRVYSYTLAISSVLAGIAGVFLGSIYVLTPSMGGDPILLSFIVIVLGGLGSFQGAIIASYIVGLIQALASLVVGTHWARVVLFLCLMLILMFRPYGLFGERVG